ncbi:MAG: serine hydrolase [Leptolyngbyaceae cyanobacterium]
MSGSGETPYQRGRTGASRSSSPVGAAKPGSNPKPAPANPSRQQGRNIWQSLFGIGRSRSNPLHPQQSSRSSRGGYSSPPLPSLQPRSLPSTSTTISPLRSQAAFRSNGSASSQPPRAIPSTPNGALRPLPTRRLRPPPAPDLALAGRSDNTLPASRRVPVDRALPAQRPTPSPQRRQRSASSRLPSRRRGAAIYAVRILILSLGIGVLAGTLLTAWDPASRSLDASRRSPKQAAVKPGDATAANPAPITLGSEITALKVPIQTLMAKDPNLQAGVFFLDLDTNAFLDINGSASFSAASTIKFPILLAFFQDVDGGKIRLDEPLTMKKELIAQESGDMQFQPPDTKFSALETATKMITISDNTATNMLIARLGGINALNSRFQSWGLTTTKLKNMLPDLEGSNQTSAKELSLLLGRIGNGDLVSVKSRDRMLAIMEKTVSDSMLPRGLGEGATIAHKTGDIGTTVGDVGLIDVPTGKRYIGGVFVKRPRNDESGPALIREISQLTYQNFAKRQPAPVPSPAASDPP